jgi:hypothetical protein
MKVFSFKVFSRNIATFQEVEFILVIKVKDVFKIFISITNVGTVNCFPELSKAEYKGLNGTLQALTKIKVVQNETGTNRNFCMEQLIRPKIAETAGNRLKFRSISLKHIIYGRRFWSTA